MLPAGSQGRNGEHAALLAGMPPGQGDALLAPRMACCRSWKLALLSSPEHMGSELHVLFWRFRKAAKEL